jgi:superfamily II DNA or RNA helicase
VSTFEKFEDYQLRAINWLAVRRRGLVKSPAGSGKTLVSAGTLAKVIGRKTRTEKVRIGWVAITQEQVEQAWKAIKVFPNVASQDIKVACAAADTDWSDRHVLVVDECHRFTTPQYKRQVLTCKGAVYGFSATTDYDGDPHKQRELLSLFGDEFFEVERHEVANRLAKARVVLLNAFDEGLGPVIDTMIQKEYAQRLKYWRGPTNELYKIVSWQMVLEYGIKHNRRRNAAAVAMAKHHARNHVLMLVNTVEHGQGLAKLIPGAVCCYSKMGRPARKRALEDFAAGRINCIVATSLADEGLDLPVADTMILVSGGRNQDKTTQRTGRILRSAPGKEFGLLYDFKDEAHSLMAKHAARRQALYRKLGYTMMDELNLTFS